MDRRGDDEAFLSCVRTLAKHLTISGQYRDVRVLPSLESDDDDGRGDLVIRFSENTMVNRRGTVSVATRERSWSAELVQRDGEWEVGETAGMSRRHIEQLMGLPTRWTLMFEHTPVAIVIEEDSDFPSISGRYELLETASTRVREYVEMSIRVNTLYENPETQGQAEQEELAFMDLIDSDQWALLDSEGGVCPILVPVFHSDGGINWRLAPIR